MENIQNKTAYITGGSRGIGKAIAIALAKEGVNIGIIGRTLSHLESTTNELKAFGVKVAHAVADVSKRTSVETAISELKSQIGSADILINNAGIAAFGSLTEMPVEKWEEIIQVNVLGVYYATHAVLPDLIEKQSGDIINISSTAGQRGNAGTSAYSASKFAVLGLTESLLMEVRKHNIRVTAITPSTVATDMTMNDLKITDGNPEKVLQAEDLAELVICQLKLNRRALVKSIGVWSTNP